MKLDTRRTVLIGFGFMSILAFWQFYDQVVPHLLENVFGLRTFTTNAIMSIDNVSSLILLPLFGTLSDKTKTRLGRRTPYILFGTLTAVCLMGVLAAATASRSFPLFFAALLCLLVTMSTYRSPAVAYMPDVTPKPLRSKANAIINLVGYIGGIFSTLMMMILLKSEKAADGSSHYAADQSFTPIFLVVAAFMLVSVLVMVLTTHENKLVERTRREVEASESTGEVQVKKGEKLPPAVFRSLIFILLSVFLWYMAYNAVTTAFSRYCVSVWGADLSTSSGYLMCATVVAILSFVPLGMLSSRAGRKATIYVGIGLMTLCYLAACFITAQTPVMYLLFGLVGIGWAAINVNSFPMVVEMSAAGDTGKYTGYYYAFSMAAQICTPLLSGLLIDNLGLGYRVLFPYAVVFSLLAALTMTQVRHGDSRPNAKQAALDALNND